MPLNIITNAQNNTDIPTSVAARDWKSFSIEISDDTSLPLWGVTNLTYSVNNTSQSNHGIGGHVVSKGFGNEEFSASIELYLWELDNILNAVQGMNDLNRSPLNIASFNIVGTYTDRNTGESYSDTIVGCTINSYEKSISEGDFDVRTTIELFPTGIILKGKN